MIEAGDGAGIALEAFAQLRLGGEMLGQDFDGDYAIQPRVASAIHFAL